MSIPQEHDYIWLSAGVTPSLNAEKIGVFNLKETELRLGLPGSEASEREGASMCFVSGAKRGFSDAMNGAEKWGLSIHGGPNVKERKDEASITAPASMEPEEKWTSLLSTRTNTLATDAPKTDDVGKSGSGCLYVKVGMDGAPYLRKIDLKAYCSYAEISSALEKMFSCFTIGQCEKGLAAKKRLSKSHSMDLLHGSEYLLMYEDKDGDWMLIGDIPWEMFTDSCRRLRIMKSPNAIGLPPRTKKKSKSRE